MGTRTQLEPRGERPVGEKDNDAYRSPPPVIRDPGANSESSPGSQGRGEHMKWTGAGTRRGTKK